MNTSQPRNCSLVALLIISFISASAQQQASVSTFLTDPATGKEYHAYDRSFALIVGVDAYKQIEPRRSSVSSAKSIKELLMSRYGFSEKNIVLLTDEQASRFVILNAMRRMEHCGAFDRVLLFFSGRGYTERDESNVEHGYFVPIDGVVQSPEQAVSSCISFDKVRALAGAMGAKQTLVLFDFSVGGLPVVKRFSGVPPLRTGFERTVTSTVMEFIAAGDRVETVADDPATGLSFFAAKIVEGLSSDHPDINRDGIITGTEMAAYVAVNVSGASGGRMHPQFGFGSEGAGDFLFVLPDNADTSKIFVVSKPADAVVFLDEKQMKPSDTGYPVFSPKVGVHSFQVQREGYSALKEEFYVNGRTTIRANVELAETPTCALFITVSEPDARVTLDGKLVGMPEHSLLLKGIAPGKHMVRADLEGYFSDSATVTTEKPVRYAVNLALHSRNAHFTVRSSEGVVISLDDAEIGRKEVIRKEIPPGTYKVRLSGIGYTEHERTFVIRDTQSVEFIYPMSRPTLAGALWRSALFPGWGQSYSGRHGFLYSVFFLGLAASSIDLQLSYAKTNSDYNTNIINYNSATNAADSQRYGTLGSDLSSKRKKENLYRYAAFGVTAGFYLYTLINVWTHDPADLIREEEAKERKAKRRAAVSLGFNDHGPAIILTYQF